MIIIVINYICKNKMNIFMLFLEICEKRKKEKFVKIDNKTNIKTKSRRGRKLEKSKKRLK